MIGNETLERVGEYIYLRWSSSNPRLRNKEENNNTTESLRKTSRYYEQQLTIVFEEKSIRN